MKLYVIIKGTKHETKRKKSSLGRLQCVVWMKGNITGDRETSHVEVAE